jgi:hypothetical protein
VSDFHLKTEVFEGPIELLLDLVEKKKLAIKNISLAQVGFCFWMNSLSFRGPSWSNCGNPWKRGA